MSIPLSVQELEEMFTYHAPKGDQQQRYQRIREAAHAFAIVVAQCVPMCADQTAAIRKIREAVMTANAGIAIQEAHREFPESTGAPVESK